MAPEEQEYLEQQRVELKAMLAGMVKTAFTAGLRERSRAALHEEENRWNARHGEPSYTEEDPTRPTSKGARRPPREPKSLGPVPRPRRP